MRRDGEEKIEDGDLFDSLTEEMGMEWSLLAKF